MTPDSFSDGGRHDALPRALAHARRMIAEGADVIDVGGESSRPPGATYGAGAAHVPVEEELRRVLPVIEALAGEARISVDTVKPEVARAALDAGASIVNDVSCGASGELLEVVAARSAELVLMHTRGGGRVDATTTAYGDVTAEVLGELDAAVQRAIARGVDRACIWIDPGIGFAKTAAQSLSLLGNLDAFVRSGYPVLVGASRKSFLARAVGGGGEGPAPTERLGASVAAVTVAALAGARAVRVHDVFESVQAARLGDAIRRGAR